MARCPFSFTKIIKLTDEDTGAKGNFEVLNPLDFLAEVTQHIPNTGEHQMHYYGWYSK